MEFSFSLATLRNKLGQSNKKAKQTESENCNNSPIHLFGLSILGAALFTKAAPL